MGYRSDIVIATTKKGMEYIESALDRSGLGQLSEYADQVHILPSGNVHIVLYGWKWNTVYPDVLAVEGALEEELGGEPFRFVRIGEEAGDWEEYDSGDISEDMYIYPCQYIGDSRDMPIIPDFGVHDMEGLIAALAQECKSLGSDLPDRLRTFSPVMDDVMHKWEESSL